ncbi:molybdopterin oxidoreductase family protein [uncultured Clostridium sp.]|uniref:molybdopterin oxidoreductase family protein n=1 Tax=uncultured Clostridium sp. TaxID=59620 RepID=UPI00261653B0|nr:molybdopterin oxidoreductase family protein [uncultured Clostridium sp.]
MEIKQSACNYCATGCNLSFTLENDKITLIRGAKEYPVNSGTACIKGLNLDKQCTEYGKQRLPLLRNEKGEMEEIGWEDAFRIFVEKMDETRGKYGDKSVAYISTGQIPIEEMALLGLIGRGFMQMHGDGNTRLCMSSSVVAYKQAFGFDAPSYTLRDLELSDTMIFIGANPAVAHPVLWGRIRKNKAAKKIAIDPRKSETVKGVDEWYDIKPKSDLILLYTLANILIENDWIDKEYIEKHTEDFEGFKNHVKKYTLEDVEEKTGMTKERVVALAETIHNGKKVSIWWTMGVNQGYEAVRTAQAIINICVMTGNIGREGTGPNSLTGQCNAMGSRLYSNTTCLYAGRDYGNENDRKVVREILGVDDEDIPKAPTLPYPEIVKGALNGEIKALWIVATNPMDSWIDNKEFKKVVDNLDFLVVQDLYSDTDTAKVADLFLPAIPAIKKEGVLINTERRLSALVPLISKKENELTDYEIFLGIGKALGREKELEKWKTPKDAFELLKECSKDMPCDITGVTYEMLRESKGVQWPFKKGEELIDDERRLFEDGVYYRPNGKVKFMYEDVMENTLKETNEYPYMLNTGRGSVGQWHTQTRTREIPMVKKMVSEEAYIEISNILASDLGIVNDEIIQVSSPNGNKVNIKAKINPQLKRDQLFAPMHYFATNQLTEEIFDAYSREPSYKFATINIKKI